MAGIAHVITPDSASGAQVIDGSLKFAGGYLTRTPSSNGNRKTWTFSCWVKFNENEAQSEPLLVAGNSSSDFTQVYTYKSAASDIALTAKTGSSDKVEISSNNLLRDTGWYHVVVVFDSTGSGYQTDSTIYVNGVEISRNANTFAGGQNYVSWVNSTAEPHYLGYLWNGNTFKGHMSQVYLIDGQALGPENFGFTDPLTNTWKPKKYNVELAVTQTVQPTYVSKSNVLDEANAFDGSSGTEATYSGTGSWLSFTVDASNLTVPFEIRNDSSGTAQTVAMFTDSGGSSAASGTWGSTGTNNLSPAVSTTVEDTYTFPSAGTYYLRHTVGTDSNIFVYRIGGSLTTGANSFYLPLDGNSPIGEDKSGNGNNWTPVNFGGSVALDNPQVSGAKPILNTTPGGNQAGVGVFGSRENVGYAVTVYDDGGGNKYYIDGTKQATLTGLIRGATYTFDTSDSTVSSHPFRFSTTTQEGGGSATLYSNGVAAITGAATTITVPHDAPNTLYYYCTSHSGMGADITGITTNEKLADQYASNCVLAVPFVGSTVDASAGLACTSTTKADTNSGSTASSAVYNFYSGSRDFDGSNDTCSFASVPACGAGDWTVEFWLYSEASSTDTVYRRIVSTGTNATSAIQIGHIGEAAKDGGYITYTHSDNSVYAVNTSNVMNRWAHIAVVRESGSVNVYTDGIKGTTADSDANDKTGTTWYVSGYGGSTSSGRFNGKIQDLRVYPGIAKYTSNFIPASTNPDILPDTPSGVSGSSKLTKITDGAVNFDGSGDYLNTAWSSDFAFGTGDFTIEMFVYWQGDTSTSTVLAWGEDIDNRFDIGCQTANQIRVFARTGGSTFVNMDVANGISTNKWIHLAVVRNSSAQTMKLYIDGVEKASTSSVTATMPTNTSNGIDIGRRRYASSTSDDYQGFISNLRIIKGTALYTSRFTPPTAPLTDVTNTKLLCCQSNLTSGAAAVSPNISGINNGTVWSSFIDGTIYSSSYAKTNMFDGVATQGTRTIPLSNTSMTWTPPSPISISSSLRLFCYNYNNVDSGLKINGTNYGNAVHTANGTTMDWYTVPGPPATLTSLEWSTGNAGAENGAFSAVEVDGTILVDPVVANGDAAATNFNPFNTDINTVRGQETGYPTLNPLSVSGLSGNRTSSTLSNNNLTSTNPGSTAWNCRLATVGVDSGKWYYEYTVNGTITNFLGGWADSPNLNWTDAVGNTSRSYGYYNTGNVRNSNSNTSFGATYTVGDVVGCAIDLDNYKIYWSKNGVWQNNAVPAAGAGSIYTVASGYQYFPAVSTYDSNSSVTVNFGQKPFSFPPPDGFQPLNAANVRPSTVIARSDQYVGVTTYKGDDQASHIINDLNFGAVPDLVWLKKRDGSGGNQLYDTIRGATKPLQSDATSGEDTQTSGLISFVRDGFELGASSTINGLDGDNGNVPFNYVAWCWKAGGNKNTFNVDDVGYASAAAAGLTGGDITPSGASVGTKQGFSIIQYAGTNNASTQTIPHGLSQKPDFMIVKQLTDSSTGWIIYHSSLGATKYLLFDATKAGTNSGPWGDTEPTSSLFTVGSGYNNTNRVSRNFISYHWHSVPGLQKFGSYEGNESTDGPFIELGFRPAMVMVRNVDENSNDWKIYDGTRNPHNVVTQVLYPNLNNSEDANTGLDFLSNGFKLRDSGSAQNGAETIIYCAWAEAPSIDLYGGGANAR